VQHLSTTLAQNCALTKLNLNSNNFGAEDIPILNEGLRVNHTLLQLNFSGNAAILDAKGFLEEQNPSREPSSENPLERPPTWLSTKASPLDKGLWFIFKPYSLFVLTLRRLYVI
jgi:hypothetical protein